MKLAIIGGGPAGFMAAITAKDKNPKCDITIFERAKPLATLLYTGGGRCNITFAEFDFKELASYYPRGEKFLYSIFSRFGVGDLFDFFEKYGTELYIQPDNRVFPKSDNAEEIRSILINTAKAKDIKIESLIQITSVKKEENFILNNKMIFDKVILATGGKNKFGFDIARDFGHGVGELTPVLCGMKLKEPFLNLSGTSLENISVSTDKIKLKGAFLFTHKGISGPVVFDLSSHLAFEKFPVKLKINFTGLDFESQDSKLIKLLEQNSKKNISNILTEYLPLAVSKEFLERASISSDKKAYEINSKERKKITKFLTEFDTEITEKDLPAMVTAGGINLNNLDKNLQSKLTEGLYFCGEILNIDGLCGGFNLQACFSTGYVAGSSAALN